MSANGERDMKCRGCGGDMNEEQDDDVLVEMMRRPDGSMYAAMSHAICRATM